MATTTTTTANTNHTTATELPEVDQRAALTATFSLAEEALRMAGQRMRDASSASFLANCAQERADEELRQARLDLDRKRKAVRDAEDDLEDYRMQRREAFRAQVRAIGGFAVKAPSLRTLTAEADALETTDDEADLCASRSPQSSPPPL
jgi:hypothetical protein